MTTGQHPTQKTAAREAWERSSRLQPARSGRMRRLRRRLRDAELWRRALEAPWLWVALLLLVGTWCLTPGASLFAPRLAPGAVAGRDYVASRDLLLYDEEATRAKQQLAREKVLPVYDFDPGVALERDVLVAQLFALGRH